MSAQTVEQLSFDFLSHLPVIVQRHAGQLSSDAGLLPLRQFDERWNYTARFAGCLHDPMAAAPDRRHSLLSMLRQRLFGILAGYEDCNDHDTLRDDPIFKLIADPLPGDEALASQPTLSRFENLATPAVLQKLIDFTIDTGIERLKQKHGGALPASITLDLDATDDPTHGHQPSGSSGTVWILRSVSILSADHQRADHQAHLSRLASSRHGACLPGR